MHANFTSTIKSVRHHGDLPIPTSPGTFEEWDDEDDDITDSTDPGFIPEDPTFYYKAQLNDLFCNLGLSKAELLGSRFHSWNLLDHSTIPVICITACRNLLHFILWPTILPTALMFGSPWT